MTETYSYNRIRAQKLQQQVIAHFPTTDSICSIDLELKNNLKKL